ncbi:MAG TPA: HisA/HisF-related TIM barrel protein [Candidatus Acidoferrum sp.]|nr:HisA/HisF-related TIM barrel protein [Candidatus Acidoferrum sp.]
MQIFPAIDLLDGKAVRLMRGERKAVTVYYKDPCEAARRMADCGATKLHVVDLDGAFDGVQKNLAVVERIAALGLFYIELGGGIRDEAAAKRAYEAGADRVILGTAALGDLAAKLPPAKVACGVDAKDGIVAVKGWTEASSVTAVELAQRMQALGVCDVIYTDVARDGAMSGPNLAGLARMTELSGLRVTASGGVSRMADLEACAAAGAFAAIVGKAYYEGVIDLKQTVARFET